MNNDAINQFPFQQGFRSGLSLWKAGFTIEQIADRSKGVGAEPTADQWSHARGMHAATVALSGWFDEVRRIARRHDVPMNDVETLIAEAVETA